MKLVLEARHLFDGSIAAVASKAAHSAHEHTHPDASHATTLVHHHHHHALNAELHRESANAALYPGIPALAPNPHATEILFVDPRVSNWQTLAAGVKGDVQVVLIDPNRDGIAQVTAALKGRSDLAAIHFLTYGQAGQLELGDAPVTAATLASHAGQVASWGDHLAANGGIEFWGCDVGAGDSGAAFVNSVHALTGAQVGASTDATGAAQLGGDWTLERTTGVLAVGTPFTTAAMAAYTGVLDTPLPTVTFDPTTVPGDILLGSTFTETVNFSNAAGNAVGYGPFIDLFVPSDANQKVTLTSATFLGTAVSFQKITITNVAGEGLGAFSPLALGSDGKPLFITAPPGYQAGDSMYVLVLPFGSFTPGQPAAAIKLTFTMDNSTELSSAPTGQPLKITASGGFQYGADPLNDPAIDQSLIGASTILVVDGFVARRQRHDRPARRRNRHRSGLSVQLRRDDHARARHERRRDPGSRFHVQAARPGGIHRRHDRHHRPRRRHRHGHVPSGHRRPGHGGRHRHDPFRLARHRRQRRADRYQDSGLRAAIRRQRRGRADAGRRAAHDRHHRDLQLHRRVAGHHRVRRSRRRPAAHLRQQLDQHGFDVVRREGARHPGHRQLDERQHRAGRAGHVFDRLRGVRLFLAEQPENRRPDRRRRDAAGARRRRLRDADAPAHERRRDPDAPVRRLAQQHAGRRQRRNGERQRLQRRLELQPRRQRRRHRRDHRELQRRHADRHDRRRRPRLRCWWAAKSATPAHRRSARRKA